MNRCILEPQRGRAGWRGQAARRLAFEPLEDRRLLDGVTGGQAIEMFGTSAALFVENQGQWEDESVRFLHQGDGVNVAMTDAGAVFQLFQREGRVRETHETVGGDSVGDDGLFGFRSPSETPPTRGSTITRTTQFSVTFDGANAVEPVGRDRAETRFNYFIGAQQDWHADVPGYEVVAYENLYQGIDLLTWGRRDSLKYEFHVGPGADYEQIQVGYEGIEGLSLEADGSLRVDLADGWDGLVDDAPYIYQVIDGQEVEVAGRFALVDADSYMFVVTDDYDPAKELILDPDLAWSTYLGGSGSDQGIGIALDAAGNALVTGETWSSDFSGRNNTHQGGDYDAFVAKVTAGGSLAWATYLGGSGGDGGWGIAVDAVGNALVTGWTNSSDFAGANNTYHGLWDAFVAKVGPAGSLAWATYLGGSYYDYGHGIAVDAADNAVVSGLSGSSDFAGANNTHHGGGEDAFVAKVTGGGSLAWATYLGGSRWDWGRGIGVDAAGNALVTGFTSSWDLAGANNTYHGGDHDAFVAKVTPGGSLGWASYLGGSSSDFGNGIAVDAAGNVLVTGWTSSSDFAGANNTYHGGGRDAFVAKIGGVVLPVKDPVLLVPGFLGSWHTPGKFPEWVRSYDRGFAPEDLRLLSLGYRPYDAMIEALEANGYEQGVDLFAAPYDWRLPIGNSPDEDFDEGVDYLNYWIEKARAAWIARGLDVSEFQVDVVAHSMGGLVTRAYIQNDPAGEVVDDFIMVGTPNHGAVDTYWWMEWGDRALLGVELGAAYGLLGHPGIAAVVLAQKYLGIDRLENFAPGVMDLLPTFDFVKDPGPEPTGKYANAWLAALNSNLSALLDDPDTTVTLVAGAKFETSREVKDWDGIGGFPPIVEEERPGDGTVLSGWRQEDTDVGTGVHLPTVPALLFTPGSALPDGNRYYELHSDQIHRNLLNDQEVQRIVFAALGILNPVVRSLAVIKRFS